MSLVKAKGQMYPWVTHTWNPLIGECPHQCSYCYVHKMSRRYPVLKGRYSGPLRLEEKAMRDNLGKGNTIFVCSCNDLFSEKVPRDLLNEILSQLYEFSENQYVLQTKNAPGLVRYFNKNPCPQNWIIGVTVESDVRQSWQSISPQERMHATLNGLNSQVDRLFVSAEPIMSFTTAFRDWLVRLNPIFVSIGANSDPQVKLPEPKPVELKCLIYELREADLEVRLKDNLKRLLQ